MIPQIEANKSFEPSIGTASPGSSQSPGEKNQEPSSPGMLRQGIVYWALHNMRAVSKFQEQTRISFTFALKKGKVIESIHHSFIQVYASFQSHFQFSKQTA